MGCLNSKHKGYNGQLTDPLTSNILLDVDNCTIEELQDRMKILADQQERLELMNKLKQQRTQLEEAGKRREGELAMYMDEAQQEEDKILAALRRKSVAELMSHRRVTEIPSHIDELERIAYAQALAEEEFMKAEKIAESEEHKAMLEARRLKGIEDARRAANEIRRQAEEMKAAAANKILTTQAEIREQQAIKAKLEAEAKARGRQISLKNEEETAARMKQEAELKALKDADETRRLLVASVEIQRKAEETKQKAQSSRQEHSRHNTELMKAHAAEREALVRSQMEVQDREKKEKEKEQHAIKLKNIADSEVYHRKVAAENTITDFEASVAALGATIPAPILEYMKQQLLLTADKRAVGNPMPDSVAEIMRAQLAQRDSRVHGKTGANDKQATATAAAMAAKVSVQQVVSSSSSSRENILNTGYPSKTTSSKNLLDDEVYDYMRLSLQWADSVRNSVTIGESNRAAPITSHHQPQQQLQSHQPSTTSTACHNSKSEEEILKLADEATARAAAILARIHAERPTEKDTHSNLHVKATSLDKANTSSKNDDRDGIFSTQAHMEKMEAEKKIRADAFAKVHELEEAKRADIRLQVAAKNNSNNSSNIINKNSDNNNNNNHREKSGSKISSDGNSNEKPPQMSTDLDTSKSLHLSTNQMSFNRSNNNTINFDVSNNNVDHSEVSRHGDALAEARLKAIQMQQAKAMSVAKQTTVTATSTGINTSSSSRAPVVLPPPAAGASKESKDTKSIDGKLKAEADVKRVEETVLQVAQQRQQEAKTKESSYISNQSSLEGPSITGNSSAILKAKQEVEARKRTRADFDAKLKRVFETDAVKSKEIESGAKLGSEETAKARLAQRLADIKGAQVVGNASSIVLPLKPPRKIAAPSSPDSIASIIN